MKKKLRQSWRWLIMKVRMQCRKIHALPVAEPENVRNVKVMAIGEVGIVYPARDVMGH